MCAEIKKALTNINETMFLLEVARLQIKPDFRQHDDMRLFMYEYEEAVSHYNPRLTRKAGTALEEKCSSVTK